MYALMSLIRHPKQAASVAAVVWGASAPAFADEAPKAEPAAPAAHGAPAEPQPAGAHAEDHHAEDHPAGGHHAHNNHVGLFVGATTNAGKTAATIGLDYEYRLAAMDRLFGIGVMADLAQFEHKEVLVAPALFVHPIGHVVAVVAPGLEHEAGETIFVLRAGVMAPFAVGPVSLAPTVFADWAHSHVAWVYGLTVAAGF